MVPFTWPPKQVAEAAWFTLTVAMTWAFFRLALHALPARRMSTSPLLWLTFFLNGYFLVKELAFGQFNLPLGLLLLGAVIAAQHGRGLAAGGLIAAAVFIKPYALVLLPWLVWTQGWRPLMLFAIVITAGLALPAVWDGGEGNIALLQDWYRTVTDTTAPTLLAHENMFLASMWASGCTLVRWHRCSRSGRRSRRSAPAFWRSSAERRSPSRITSRLPTSSSSFRCSRRRVGTT